MITLPCSSMAHVSDRAWAFLFASPPYKVLEVRPDGVILERPDSEGVKGETLYVKVVGHMNMSLDESNFYRTPLNERLDFIDEVNNSPVKPMSMYAKALYNEAMDQKVEGLLAKMGVVVARPAK